MEIKKNIYYGKNITNAKIFASFFYSAVNCYCVFPKRENPKFRSRYPQISHDVYTHAADGVR